MVKRASWRLVKRHRCYTVDEASRLFQNSKGTIRHWIKDGLPIIGDKKPFLIEGENLIEYLKRKSCKRQKCALDECYCFHCRKPQKPAFGAVEILLSNSKLGNMQALCGQCTGLMFKRVSYAQIEALEAILQITIKQADAPIRDSAEPRLNGHLQTEKSQ